MCYCCRNWSFYMFGRPNLGGRGRPWEAVGGRAPLIGSDRSHSQSGEHGLPRPHTASQIRPHTASHGLPSARPPTICHVICLSQSGEHGLPRPPTFGLTRPPISLPLWPPAASHFGLLQPPTSASQFGLSHGLSLWPLTWASHMACYVASHLGLSHGLSLGPLTWPLTWPLT